MGPNKSFASNNRFAAAEASIGTSAAQPCGISPTPIASAAPSQLRLEGSGGGAQDVDVRHRLLGTVDEAIAGIVAAQDEAELRIIGAVDALETVVVLLEMVEKREMIGQPGAVGGSPSSGST